MSELISRVRELLGDALMDSHDYLGDDTALVEAGGVLECLHRLRDDPQLAMNFLMDLTAVDYLDREPRFEVVYHLASIDTEPRGTEPSRLRHLERRLDVAPVTDRPAGVDDRPGGILLGEHRAARLVRRGVQHRHVEARGDLSELVRRLACVRDVARGERDVDASGEEPGAVGGALAQMCLKEGAQVSVCDLDYTKARRFAEAHGATALEGNDKFAVRIRNRIVPVARVDIPFYSSRAAG